MLTFRKILCPVDFSPPSRDAMRVAVEAALRFDAALTIFHAYSVEGYAMPEGYVPLPEEQRKRFEKDVETSLAAWKKEADEQAGGRVELRTAAQVGDAVTEILRFATDDRFDLIVMGTHGRTGMRHLLIGSVAERVLRRSPCAVLTVRPTNHAQSTAAPTPAAA